MGSDNYLKTELKIVSVIDLDGNTEDDNQPRNILREKTFNSELNSLVNKIFNNEKVGESVSEISDSIDPIEKQTILDDYEKLIYRIKHFDDINSSSIIFNPFDTDINVYDDIDDTADYIKAGLFQSGHTKYQILKYNFQDKAYRSDINYLDSSYSSDMYFSNDDPLLIRLQELSEGFILTYEMISSDTFFTKKFNNNDVDGVRSGPFYIVKISSLIKDTGSNSGAEKKLSRFEEYLSPLLLIELGPGSPFSAEGMFELLKKTASLPLHLYFLKNEVHAGASGLSYNEILQMIELFIKSIMTTKIKCYYVTLTDISDKSGMFIFKYFLSRIRKIFRKDSLILIIGIDRAIIITAFEMDEVTLLLERINSGGEILRFTYVDYNEFLTNRNFIDLFL